MLDYDIVIIGGGPAGISAGIYAARSGLKSVLLEKMFIGGQAINSQMLENYPGFENGISGTQFAQTIEKQAKNLGLEIVKRAVKEVNLSESGSQISTAKDTYNAKAVIIAAGANPRKLNMPLEQELTGRGISYCATCDGMFFKDKAVAVIGGGETAINDAIYLSKLAAKVYIVHRRDEFRASKASVDKLKSLQNVEFVFDSVLTKLNGDTSLTSIDIENVKTMQSRNIQLDGIFVAVGSVPQTELFKGQLHMINDHIVTQKGGLTNVKGVYAAGDITYMSQRQVVIAAGEGAEAAMNAIEYVNSK